MHPVADAARLWKIGNGRAERMTAFGSENCPAGRPGVGGSGMAALERLNDGQLSCYSAPGSVVLHDGCRIRDWSAMRRAVAINGSQHVPAMSMYIAVLRLDTRPEVRIRR